MRVAITHLENPQALLANPLYSKLTADRKDVFNNFLKLNQHIWIGSFDGEAACIWGVVTPTLLSNQAYLWLHIDENAVAGNQFLFIRHSQRVIESLLKEFETIVGVTQIGADRSIRWLKWLGASFGVPDGKMIPFSIRKRNG